MDSAGTDYLNTYHTFDAMATCFVSCGHSCSCCDCWSCRTAAGNWVGAASMFVGNAAHYCAGGAKKACCYAAGCGHCRPCLPWCELRPRMIPVSIKFCTESVHTTATVWYLNKSIHFQQCCKWHTLYLHYSLHLLLMGRYRYTIPLITSFMGPTWGPPGSGWPQMGPMLAPWNLL